MLLKFVDRKEELDALEKAWKSGKAEFAIIYGRRRMGKTELIKRFMEKHGGFYFMARLQKPELEIERFREKFGRKYDMFLEGETWEELFREIAEKRNREIIIIDEFPYWVVKDRSVLSEFQYIWDEILRESGIFLILLGSYMSVMEEDVMGYKSPLYGRRTLQVEIKPMHVRYLKEFLPSYSTENLIRSFGATDTIPYYMAQFRNDENFWDNIANTFLNTSSPMYMDAEILLSSELREYNTYFNIIKAIIDGSTKVTEIANRARVNITNISKYLKVLQGMKLIKRIKPITAAPKERNYLYELEDNYMRFYLTYVYPYKEEIEAEREAHMDFIKNDYNRYMGKVFEIFIEKSLRDITGLRFSKVGKWWHGEDEIDIVGINESEKEILFAECKWKEKVDAEKVLRNLREKSKKVRFKGKKERYAVFARSFKKRTDDCLCYDLKDIGLKIWGK